MPHPNCPKCSGLLVSEIATDWHAGLSCTLIYCVNCSKRFDAVMLRNRANPPAAVDGRTLPKMVWTPQVARV